MTTSHPRPSLPPLDPGQAGAAPGSVREPLDSFETELLGRLREQVHDRGHAAYLRPTGRVLHVADRAGFAGPARPAWPARPVRPARPRRRALSVAASALAVAGLAGGLTLTTGTPAYALGTDSPGRITVSVTRLEDAAGLEAALAAHGIRAEVDYLPQGMVCAPGRGHEVVGPNGVSEFQFGAGGASLTLSTAGWRPEWTLLLSTSGDLSDSAGSLAVVDGPVGGCQPVAFASLGGGDPAIVDAVQPGEPPISGTRAS